MGHSLFLYVPCNPLPHVPSCVLAPEIPEHDQCRHSARLMPHHAHSIDRWDNAIGSNLTTQRLLLPSQSDVPRGTMDDVSWYVRLSLPLPRRQGRAKDCSTSSSNPMMEGPWCRVRREARARERHQDWSAG